ncbi:MAG: cytochrome C oxidase subunit IV family protein [bacterium]
MSDHHHHADDHAHHEHPHVNYMKIFWTLLILTLAEYFYAMLTQSNFTLLVVGLMTLALIKASLVGYYFMHVKFEGKWVFAMIIPACVLAAIAVLALVPDIARDRSQDELIIPEDDSAMVVPQAELISSTSIFRI